MVLLLLFLGYALALSVALWFAGFRSAPEALAAPEAPAAEAGTADQPRRILIVGATGGTGRQLIDRALQRGYEVTALARDPARLEVEHPRLTIRRGDVLDEASVEAAVSGQQAVVCALGHKRFFYPNRILSRGTENILRAMETHGVARLVCETSLGIGSGAGRMGLYYTFFTIPLILPFYFWDKTRQERAIAGSSVEWVIVRPAVLTNASPRGGCRQGRVGNYLWTARVSRADVADFMLDQLESSTYLGSAPGLSW